MMLRLLLVLIVGPIVCGAVRCGACASSDIPCLLAAVAAHPQDWDARKQLGIALTHAAVLGERDAAARGREQLRVVVAARPEDALARVHLGWAIVLVARDAPWNEMRALAVEGFREMDAAVALAPEDVRVRFVRARSDSVMPLPAGRETIAAADFAWLVARVRDEDTNMGLRRAVLFHAGALALKQRRSEAVALLEEAARCPGDDPSDEAMQSMLALARREFTPPEHAHGQGPEEKG